MKDIQQRIDPQVKLVGLRKIREMAGLKSNELAVRAGYDSAKVSRLECGKVGFTSITLGRLSVALGCKPADLFDPSDDRLKEIKLAIMRSEIAQLESRESDVA